MTYLELRNALRDNQFCPYLQVQVDVESNKPVAMEVLARWVHPTMGVLDPEHFIPMCNRSGLTTFLDKRIMDQALERYFVSSVYRAQELTFSFNVCVAELLEDPFIARLQKMVKQYRLNPENIALEIKEEIFCHRPELIEKRLKELHAAGFKITIDDFSMAFTTETALKNLPISAVKLDKKLLNNLLQEPSKRDIVMHIMQVAKKYNIDVIGKGIETKPQLAYFYGLGCKQMQGAYFSMPLSFSESEQQLQQGRFNKVFTQH